MSDLIYNSTKPLEEFEVVKKARQKSGDLISREETIKAISTWDKFGVDERCRVVRWYEGLEPYVHLRDVVTAIVNMPSASQWIPCGSITEPIDREVLCCDKNGNELIGWLDYNDYYECWVCESDGCVMYDTVAYTEKPKPYEGRTE